LRLGPSSATCGQAGERPFRATHMHQSPLAQKRRSTPFIKKKKKRCRRRAATTPFAFAAAFSRPFAHAYPILSPTRTHPARSSSSCDRPRPRASLRCGPQVPHRGARGAEAVRGQLREPIRRLRPARRVGAPHGAYSVCLPKLSPTPATTRSHRAVFRFPMQPVVFLIKKYLF
jgi:hypothetical protein